MSKPARRERLSQPSIPLTDIVAGLRSRFAEHEKSLKLPPTRRTDVPAVELASVIREDNDRREQRATLGAYAEVRRALTMSFDQLLDACEAPHVTAEAVEETLSALRTAVLEYQAGSRAGSRKGLDAMMAAIESMERTRLGGGGQDAP